MDIKIILALLNTKGIGPKTLEKVLQMNSHYDEPESPIEIVRILQYINSQIGIPKIPNRQEIAIGWNKGMKILKDSLKNDVEILQRNDPNFPQKLLVIPNPPLLIHVKGNVNVLNKDAIAIVGTRKPTDFGKRITRNTALTFSKEGYVIVSGLANGIDTEAHKGAIDANGITLAILAHGIHTISPKRNTKLADEIIDNGGALISEYSWGIPGVPRNFVERDRLQSGISLGVMVIESGRKSGTMHTANFCKDQNRSLFVYSHPDIYHDIEQTKGNEFLLKNDSAISYNEDTNITIVKNHLQQSHLNITKMIEEFRNKEISFIMSDHSLTEFQ